MRVSEEFREFRSGNALFIALLALVFLYESASAQDMQTREIVEQATTNAAEKAAEKATEKVAEMVAREAAAQAEELAAEKAELTAKRPDARRPTRVKFLVFVIDIDGIDDASQNFEANVYIRLRWMDKRLTNPEGATRQMPLNEVWNPRVLLANRQGIVSKSLPEVV